VIEEVQPVTDIGQYAVDVDHGEGARGGVHEEAR